MTSFYLDTSVAVHALNGLPSAESWFDAVATSTQHRLISSRILQTELSRVLRRDALPLNRRDALLQSVDIVPVTEGILTAAEAITVHLKTLDAIHLASALAFGSDTVVATHDAALQAAVDSVGLTWVDPVHPSNGPSPPSILPGGPPATT